MSKKYRFNSLLNKPPSGNVTQKVSIPLFFGRIFPVSDEAVWGWRVDFNSARLARRFVTQSEKLENKIIINLPED